MMDQLTAALQALGLDKWVPIVLACHALASTLDAAIPQPAVGSHWLPLRKLLSIAAGNVANATNLLQPSVVTWLQKVLIVVATLVPEPAPVAPAAPAPAVTGAPPVPPAPTAAATS